MIAKLANQRDGLVERYVSVWNEARSSVRRKLVQELWVPDGVTCQRLLESRGHYAIYERITGAWEKWVRDEGQTFSVLASPVACHNLVRMMWQMAPASGGSPVARGVNFLVLAEDGRIRTDYQFPVPAASPDDEHAGLLARYLEIWNEGDELARKRQIAATWSAGARFLSGADRQSRTGIEEEAKETFKSCGAEGFFFEILPGSDGHHGAIRFNWQMRSRADDAVAAEGAGLLILDDAGHILFDYQLDPEPTVGD